MNQWKYLLQSEVLLHKTIEIHRVQLGLITEYEYKAAYLEIIGKYLSNYFDIEVNGLDNFLKWGKTKTSQEFINAILRRIEVRLFDST